MNNLKQKNREVNQWINKIHCGDALEVLKQIPGEIVNCCVTSPPYWGLRDYGTAKWEGGDPECDHTKKNRSGNKCITGHQNDTKIDYYIKICKKCGAKRIDNQLGLEKTSDEYVHKLVEIFQEIKRVLRKDGTIWLNLGDSYAGSGKGGHSDTFGHRTRKYLNRSITPFGLKPKDLIGIPWMVAFALRDQLGFYLRQDIIWYKKNPMPESVTDRCTKSHEYIFLLSKSTKYYYDADAIAEKSEWFDIDNRSKTGPTIGKKSESGIYQYNRQGVYNEKGTRNKRSVWTVNTKPFSEAHFAVFPGKLIEDCIKAGCPAGGIVLDPFIGSGTTAIVARKQDKNYIGIELNEKYIKMAQKRIHKELGMFK